LNRPERYADTDLCVKCGLCLPHCPTYSKTLDENESPRGRLSLIQGWARGDLEASPELVGHLDNCLLCRSCEAACPAYVPYGSIVDRFRGEIGSRGKPLAGRVKAAALRNFLSGESGAGWLQALLSAGTTASARRLLRNSGLLKILGFQELELGLPETAARPRWEGLHPAETPGAAETRTALFLGCTAHLLDSETATSALRVLNRLGVTVHVPDGQTCCGALHRHAGKRDSALAAMKTNLAAFGPAEPAAIVTFASGCAATLGEYAEWTTEPEADRFSKKVKDISQFLMSRPWPENVEIKPLKAKVCVHSPCTLRNVLRADRHAVDLLKRIPGAEIAVLPGTLRCCGAAGSYMLEHPEMAKSLRNEVLDRVLALEPDFLATSNPGCALHLRAGLRSRGRKNIEVLHPVTLLARQL
jgi:glycolate oxidase iron-sulfur subunit